MIAVFTNSNRTSSLLSGLFTYFLLPLPFLNCVTPLNSQSLNLFDVDASAYPIIKAKFFAFDAQGVQQRPLSTDLVLKENNISRNITSVICPSNPPTKALSSVLVIDISGSMFGGRGNAFNIDLAKSAAKAWVNGLPQGKSECAVTSFNDFNYMNQDFTNDKQKLITAINKLWPGGGTNYDAALINPMAGGLQVSARGKHERVIVMLTDGFAYPPDMNAVLNEAKKQSCIIYCVTLGMPAPQSLIDIALQTGGKYFENVTTITDAEQIYRSILQTSKGTEPCSITWETSCQPDSISNIDLSWQNVSSKGSYKQPQNAKGALTFSPVSYRFKDPVIGSDITQKVTITASNSKITISNIVPSNSAYNLTPSSFTLQANESKELTLKYRAIDSGLTFCKFSFVSDGCEQEYYATGGYTGKKPSKPTLKLTHPNGGEQFVVGSDTVITWQGISPSDSVQLDFSTNNGKTWKVLADNVTNLEYEWKNVPQPTSDNCKIRVSQKNSGNVNIDSNGTAVAIIIDCSGSMLDVISTIDNKVRITEAKNAISQFVDKLNPSDDAMLISYADDSYVNQTWTKNKLLLKNAINSLIPKGFTAMNEAVIRAIDSLRKHPYPNRAIVLLSDGVNNRLPEFSTVVKKIKEDTNNVIPIYSIGLGLNKNDPLELSGLDTLMELAQLSNGRMIEANTSKSLDSAYKLFTDEIISISKRNGSNYVNAPKIIVQKSFGGSLGDFSHSVIETSDGSILIAGHTLSTDLDVLNKRGGSGNSDLWLLKLDNNGSKIWQRTFGGSDYDIPKSVFEATDGSIILFGETKSSNLDVLNKRGGSGNSDLWLLKLDNNGSKLWQKTYGGSKDDFATQAIQATDGSFILLGETKSTDLDILNKRGGGSNQDLLILKINSEGNLLWQKTYGGTNEEKGASIHETMDGLFVVAGTTYSDDLDVTDKRSVFVNNADFWIFKIDGNGKLLWQEVYGGSNDEIASSLIENSDGNIFVTGTTNSNNLDISNKRGGQGDHDIWVLKLNTDGNLLWQKTFGGTENDESSSIKEISDGSIIIAGNTYSNDLDVSSKRGAINESDAWIIKLDIDGNVIWEKTSGGSDYDISNALYERNDGQLIIVGNTKSKNFDVKGKRSGGNDSDFWYYTLNSDSSPLQQDVSDTTFHIVEPIAMSKDIDMGSIIVGSIIDSVIPDFVSNIGSYPFQVKNIFFTGNDASVFSLVSGTPMYKVDVNKVFFGEFRFAPKRSGMHEAQVHIVTQSDTLIQNIRGMGVSKSIIVKNSIIDFGSVNLGQSKDTIQSATITNTGTVPIQITRIRHGLPNDIDFTTLQGGALFTLQPDSTHTMNLRFSPKDIGLTSGVLEFSYNGIGSPAIVQLFGRGRVGPKITSSFSGAVLNCGNDTTISIVVQNPGDDTLFLSNGEISGLHSNDFSLTNSFPKAVVNNDSLTLNINVRRNGTGLRNAEVVLQTNVNGIDSIFTIPIQVQVESINLAFEIDTLDIGTLSPGSTNDTFIVINNNGTIATGFKSSTTSNINQLKDSIIQPSNVYRLPMRVTIPSQETTISENIIITDDICGRSDTLYVIGRSRISDTIRTTVSLPNISAKPGDTISITMAITNSDKLNLPGAPVNYTATIGINPSIVHVTDNSLTYTKVDNFNYQYTFTGIRQSDSILLTIPAIATLGPTDRTPLEIVSFKWIDTLIANEVETIDGSVTITDLCEDGGVRLFIPGGSSFSLTSRPNPAASTVELLFGLAEPTPVSIKIIDYTGQIVATPVSEPSIAAGIYTRTIDVSTLPVGPYVIMLTSPNSSLHSRMDILR